MDQLKLTFPPAIPLIGDYGPLMFGGCGSKFRVIKTSDGEHKIICGGVGAETAPIRLFEHKKDSKNRDQYVQTKILVPETPDYIVTPTIINYSGNGTNDLILNTRNSILYLARAKSKEIFPEYHPVEPLRDVDGKIFSIEYRHPAFEMDTLNGYIDERFYNYLLVEVIDWFGDGGRDLIIGDQTGVIWLLEDKSQGRGTPQYTGEHYHKNKRKDDSSLPSFTLSKLDPLAKSEIFSRPTTMLKDHEGNVIRVGKGVWGAKDIDGFFAKPHIVDWDSDGKPDILIACGDRKKSGILFYRNIGTAKDGTPLLKNEGFLSDSDGNRIYAFFHDYIAALDWFNDGKKHLLAGDGGKIRIYKNISLDLHTPKLKLDSYLCQENVTLSMATKLIIRDFNNDGRPDIMEGGHGIQIWYNISTDHSKPVFNPYPEQLVDDTGSPIHTIGETDPTGYEEFTNESPFITDWDNDGVDDLIIGGDTGHIYFFKGHRTEDGTFPKKFTPCGRIKDINGHEIKHHNRAYCCLLDVDGDSLDELVISGATYQLGHKTDPNPGGKLVWHKIIRTPGTYPVLSEPHPFIVDGSEVLIKQNHNSRINSGDFDNDGNIELLLVTNALGNRIIRHTDTNGIREWHYAERLPKMFYFGCPGDIDCDGWTEFVHGGGEHGPGFYHPNPWKR
ncbi:MAG: hypothetical protein WC955_10665 [Elusimicrobiota bacterium]